MILHGKETNTSSEGKTAIGRMLAKMHPIRLIVVAVVLIVVIGFVSYIVLLQQAASSLEIAGGYVDDVEGTDTMYEYKADVVVFLKNPTTTTINVDYLTYSAYLEEDFVGSGQTDEFSVNPGTENYSFPIIFSLAEASNMTRNTFMQGSATMYIMGNVTVPIMTFGVRGGSATVPYTLETQVGAGNNSSASPVFLASPTRKILSTDVRLDWTHSTSTSFSQYEVHMSEESDFTPSSETIIQSITDIDTTTTTVAGLDIGETYYFKIRIVDALGLFADSNEQSYVHRVLRNSLSSAESIRA